MANGTVTCAHCGVPIVDPTTQVVTSELTFCCPNCSQAMQQRGSGSDKHPKAHAGDLRCARCGVAIVDEMTLEMRGDQAFCCGNCARVMADAPNARQVGGGRNP